MHEENSFMSKIASLFSLYAAYRINKEAILLMNFPHAYYIICMRKIKKL